MTSELVAAARAYKGTPFRHQGRNRSGIDCIGLVVAAHRDVGLMLRDTTAYGRRPDWRRILGEGNAQLTRLPEGTALEAGMVALFAAPGWAHVGILTAPDRFLHARGPEGVGAGVVEHRLDTQTWAPRLRALWRHPGLEAA